MKRSLITLACLILIATIAPAQEDDSTGLALRVTPEENLYEVLRSTNEGETWHPHGSFRETERWDLPRDLSNLTYPDMTIEQAIVTGRMLSTGKFVAALVIDFGLDFRDRGVAILAFSIIETAESAELARAAAVFSYRNALGLTPEVPQPPKGDHSGEHPPTPLCPCEDGCEAEKNAGVSDCNAAKYEGDLICNIKWGVCLTLSKGVPWKIFKCNIQRDLCLNAVASEFVNCIAWVNSTYVQCQRECTPL